MIKIKTKMMGLLLPLILTLSVPVVYADNGNGGNFTGGQTTVTDNQASLDQGNHEWRRGHCSKHGKHMKGRFFHKLNLTDDQKKQLKDVWHKQREAMKSTVEQIKINKEALNKELILPSPDMNKVNTFEAQLKTLHAQMADNRLSSTLEVKKILTPEQFSKYLELQNKKSCRHCRHRICNSISSVREGG
ncbi:MAG: Spy/CpxP family protein refolding chaperone [Candidatus Omnitrophica bacterium]|nr:Spy/CpxP family protein refolding chaperone [Candidatus Omnitrophota bacterium]